MEGGVRMSALCLGAGGGGGGGGGRGALHARVHERRGESGGVRVSLLLSLTDSA